MWGGVLEAPATMDVVDNDTHCIKPVFTAAGEELLWGRLWEKLRELMSAPKDSLLVRHQRSPTQFHLIRTLGCRAWRS